MNSLKKQMNLGLFLAMIVVFISTGPLTAQVNLGSIQGNVVDTQNAAIPNASVTLKNENTGVTQTSTSNPSGHYGFLNISPGNYTLTVESQGFTTSAQEHILIGTGASVSLNAVMKPGQAQQTVVVAANAANVDTQTSEIGTVITPQEIKDLPVSLNADMRNPLNFVVLTPGVAGSEPGASPDYRLHFSGSVSYANEVYIDGVPLMNTNLSGDISGDHPPQDAISQFKVVNNTQTAQYGLSSGIVSFAFDSGTNLYHGSLFEYLQNDALDAAGYVTNALGLKKAPLKQNEFGGTFGGPVRIPKLYNGKDKTFFFVDYTEFKYRPSANNATLTTFPNEFRTGNFSQILGPQLTDPTTGDLIRDPAGRPVYQNAIYDPLSAHNVIGPDGQTYTVRDPFPGNVIPGGTPGLSTASQKILSSFPTASNDAVNDNYNRLQSSKIDEHRLVVKIDEHISEKHSLSGSVFTGGYSNSNNGGLNLLDGVVTSTPTVQIRLTYNYAHSATLFNNLNVGYIRDKGVSGPVEPGPGFGALGLTGLPALTAASFYPGIELGTNQNSIGQNSSISQSFDSENRYIINDNVTKIIGSHSLGFGGEVRYLQRNEGGAPGGYFDFASTESALNGTGFIAGNQAVSIPAQTGDPRASFLFGGTDFSYISYPVEAAYRWWQTGIYVQDNWRVNPDLVLNLGVRYDLQIPRTDAHGNVSTMDPTLPNPSAGGLPGAYTFYGTGAGRNGISRIGNIYRNGFQPRIGFSFSPGAHTTAVRGGFAVTRPIGNDNSESDIGGTLYNTGFSGLATANRPGDEVGSPAYYWDNPYPAASVSGQTLNPGLLVGNDNPTMIHPDSGKPPTQLYWSMQVQQQMSGSVVLNLGYVGMHTYHVGVWSKPNEVNPTLAQQKYGAVAAANGLPLSQFLLLPINDPRVASAGITSPWPGFVSTFGTGATAGQALRPWPQYGDVDNPLNPIASVSYNGLQSSLQKRFSHGLTFLVSYTFSKTIGDADSNDGPSAGGENAQYSGSYFQDFYNNKAERAVTSSDVPHVVSLSYTYELPVGPGKSFLTKGGLVGRATGGWSVSGIQQYQSGRPIHIEYDSVGAGNPFFAAGDGYSFRPNIVPGQPFKNPAYNSNCSGPILAAVGRNPCQFYINPAAFSSPAVGTFGNAPNFISSLRMPSYYDEDLSVSKRTKLTERLDLQFQANFFNAFNRVVFSNGGNATTFIQNYAPPDLSAGSLANSTTVFGIMTAQQNAPRIIQFGARLEF
jgi:hypothetical protein